MTGRISVCTPLPSMRAPASVLSIFHGEAEGKRQGEARWLCYDLSVLPKVGL